MALHFYNLRHANAFLLGRRAHWATMRRKGDERRRQLVHLLALGKIKKPDDLAAVLGCDRATIYRDLRVLKEVGRCAHCGQLLPQVVDPAAFDAG